MPRLRILIAPTAFKGTLSAREAAAALAAGARKALPEAKLDLLPISDGGDGLIETLIAAKGGGPDPGSNCDRLALPAMYG